jgi:SpoVK/Ycf46/Vps4 family AAA+-type ATPase
VVLIDEVEKVFVKDQDNGVMQRMMSQLLWWLSEHRSQVLTVMTTNDRSKIPPELFREGRINDTLTIPPMTASNALILAQEYLKSILGPKLTLKHTAALQFKSSETYTAVWVINYVVSLIKENGWGVESS